MCVCGAWQLCVRGFSGSTEPQFQAQTPGLVGLAHLITQSQWEEEHGVASSASIAECSSPELYLCSSGVLPKPLCSVVVLLPSMQGAMIQFSM